MRSERNQHNTTIVTVRMHMAIGMIRRKQNTPMATYIQKNVCSIISVNCLLDLTLLPYFENIFVCFLWPVWQKENKLDFY